MLALDMNVSWEGGVSVAYKRNNITQYSRIYGYKCKAGCENVNFKKQLEKSVENKYFKG